MATKSPQSFERRARRPRRATWRRKRTKMACDRDWIAANVRRNAEKYARSRMPRCSGRGGRRFKSCHSDQHLAENQIATATDIATDTR